MTWLSLDGTPQPLSTRAAGVAALLVGAAAMLVVLGRHAQGSTADIDQVWYAARVLLDGRNPYDAIGPGREFEWGWPLYYPLPAVVLLLPWAPLPVLVARLSITVVPAMALVYLLARHDRRWLVPVVLSRALFFNVYFAQWSILLTLALLVPAVGIVFAGKPHLGVACLAAFRDRRSAVVAISAALVPVLIAFALEPRWPVHWFHTTRSATHLTPVILFTGGFVLLLAALRWQRWEGRLLLALALVPQTAHVYATLPLLLIAKSYRAALAMSLLSFVPFVAANLIPGVNLAWLVLPAAYFPALVLVLRLPKR